MPADSILSGKNLLSAPGAPLPLVLLAFARFAPAPDGFRPPPVLAVLLLTAGLTFRQDTARPAFLFISPARQRRPHFLRRCGPRPHRQREECPNQESASFE